MHRIPNALLLSELITNFPYGDQKSKTFILTGMTLLPLFLIKFYLDRLVNDMKNKGLSKMILVNTLGACWKEYGTLYAPQKLCRLLIEFLLLQTVL